MRMLVTIHLPTETFTLLQNFFDLRLKTCPRTARMQSSFTTVYAGGLLGILYWQPSSIITQYHKMDEALTKYPQCHRSLSRFISCLQ